VSDNLALDQVAEGQDSSEITINDKGGQLDAAITEVLSVAVTNTNAYTLSATQLRRNFMFHVIDGAPVPTATITLTVPGSIERGTFGVINDTSFDVEVEITGQTEPVVTVGSGDTSAIYSDGINTRSIGGGGGGAFLPIDGSLPMTGDLEIVVGGIDINIDPASATTSYLTTDSLFWEFVVDFDGTSRSMLLSASSLIPSVTDVLALGESSFRWSQLLVGTGTSDFRGHVGIDNQMELRLYELDANGSSYSALRAAAAMAGTVTYTLPDADGAAGAELSTSGAGVLSWVPPPYDVVGFFATAPGNGELITRVVFNRAVTMATNLTGSQGFLGTATTLTTTFDLQKNGVSFGSMTFTGVGATVATFTSTAASFAAGDRFEIVGQNPADASAANLSYALRATRA
jgi:hypothetical protein